MNPVSLFIGDHNGPCTEFALSIRATRAPMSACRVAVERANSHPLVSAGGVADLNSCGCALRRRGGPDGPPLRVSTGIGGGRVPRLAAWTPDPAAVVR